MRDKDKEQIVAILSKVFKNQNVQVLAYGSRVDGTAHDMSDLDLAIKADKKIDIEKFNSLKKMFQDSNIPILIQVIDYNRVPNYFHKNILRNYYILFETKTAPLL
ncbi:nucleotidyltransferase domain-containing protein [Sulfurimonas sp.]